MADSSDTSTRRSAAPDRHQIERLNRDWAILDEEAGTGLRGRFAALARRLFRRPFVRQQEFNAVLVDHLNRNMPVLDELVRARERMEDVADAVQREREALAAREIRIDAAVASLVASHRELRTAVNVVQQATQQLKRELSRPRADDGASGQPGTSPAPPSSSAASTQFESLDSHKYVGFENEFRGSPEEIARRIESYLPFFDGSRDVLDVGCGRGEFLESLAARGISARGIDLNPSMVDVCQAKGLKVDAADALTYLRAQPDGSLGGLFAAQVVEHLEPSYLVQFLDAAFDKLRPGSAVVLETINPACWLAFFESYIRDITHVRPIHPDTLKYLLVASGFQSVEIQYRSPYPEGEKLQAVATEALGEGASAHDAVETINANVAKINGLLFTWMDYAAIGRRG
ncbi:MAG: methyltransferase domain-containing protein [Vicinamibacterales bacterium]